MNPDLTMADRVERLRAAFPKTTAVMNGDRAEGMLMLGADFKRAWDFHGAYLSGYLHRIGALFPDAEEADTAHLFAGHVPRGPWLRVDIYDRLASLFESTDPNFMHADIGDAGQAPPLPDGAFAGRRLLLADPPYHAKDCELYGCRTIDRRKCLREIARVSDPGTWLVWLDSYDPIVSRKEWEWVGLDGNARGKIHASPGKVARRESWTGA